MSEEAEYKGPKWRDLLVPILEVLKDLGGSGSVSEIEEALLNKLNLPDDIVNFPHDNYQSELFYQAAWTRTNLKYIGYIENSNRKIWVLTEKAENDHSWNQKELIKKYNQYLKEKRESQVKKKQKEIQQKQKNQDMKDISIVEELEEIEELHEEEEIEESWRSQLKKILLQINPFGFERLVQRILRESGFVEINITSKTGDGGFDGQGVLKLNNLVSIPVIFECKRYKDPVSEPKIRNFRGAMVGRADRGLFITTSTFTNPAKNEAVRMGTAPIDLIDGEMLIDIMKDLELGVKIEMKEEVTVEESFFDLYKSN